MSKYFDCGHLRLVSDDEALQKANSLTVEQQNHRFSREARDQQLEVRASVRRPQRVMLVNGHAVIDYSVSAVEKAPEPVIHVAAPVSDSGFSVRAGRGLYGLNKKRRERFGG
ncbi:hypothetical protein ACI2KR_07680 [Pseudomonas luteola]